MDSNISAKAFRRGGAGGVRERGEEGRPAGEGVGRGDDEFLEAAGEDRVGEGVWETEDDRGVAGAAARARSLAAPEAGGEGDWEGVAFLAKSSRTCTSSHFLISLKPMRLMRRSEMAGTWEMR